MDKNILAGAAGILLSLICAYVPGIKQRYNKLDAQHKALVMLGLLVLVTLGAFGLSCVKWFDLPITCNQTGAESLIIALVVSLITNQSTFMIAVKPFRAKAK